MEGQQVVLVAEDDGLVRSFINLLLKREGYTVLLAADGEEALALSRHYTGQIDLLLSDIVMPRMDGLCLAQTLREERPGTKTLLISGQVSSEIFDRNAFFNFLRKPFVSGQLKSKLREMLGTDGAQRTP